MAEREVAGSIPTSSWSLTRTLNPQMLLVSMYVEEMCSKNERNAGGNVLSIFARREFILFTIISNGDGELFLFFSETPLQLQRRKVSFIIPKTEDGKKRVLEQSQLLDGMLL